LLFSGRMKNGTDYDDDGPPELTQGLHILKWIFYPIGAFIAILAISLSVSIRYYMIRRARRERASGLNPVTGMPMGTASIGYAPPPPAPSGSTLPAEAYPRQQAPPVANPAYSSTTQGVDETKYQTEYGLPPAYSTTTK